MNKHVQLSHISSMVSGFNAMCTFHFKVPRVTQCPAFNIGSTVTKQPRWALWVNSCVLFKLAVYEYSIFINGFDGFMCRIS